MCTGTRLRYACECVEYHYSSRCVRLGCPTQTNEAFFPNYKINTPCPNHMNSYQKKKFDEAKAVYGLPSDIQSLSAKLDEILEATKANATTNNVNSAAATTTPIRTPCTKVDKSRELFSLNENSPTHSPRKKVRFSGSSFKDRQAIRLTVAKVPVRDPVPPPIINGILSGPLPHGMAAAHTLDLDEIAKDIITLEIDTQLNKLYQKLKIYTQGSRDHLEAVSASPLYNPEERKEITARTYRCVDNEMEELFDDAMEHMAEAVFKEVMSKLIPSKDLPAK